MKRRVTRLATSVSIRKDGRLTVRVEQDGDSLVVRALGELDIATANSLDEEMRRVWRRDAAPIVLDLGEVDFLDSVGRRSLLAVAKHSRESEDRVRIRRDSAAVRRMITVSGLEGALPLVES
jgi:anti-anti-sigma factor